MVQALSTPTASRQAEAQASPAKRGVATGTAALLSGDVSTYQETSLNEAIARSRKYARLVTLACGDASQEAAIAWEQVDELLSARAKYQQVRPQSSFEQYCALNPDAMECRIYDA